MTKFTKYVGLLCGALIAAAPALGWSADEPTKSTPANPAKPAQEKNEARKKKSIQAAWLKGIELTEQQSKEIAELSETYEKEIALRQANVNKLVSPEKLKEVNAKVKEARENGQKGQQLKSLRESLLGLSDEQLREYNGLVDLVNQAKGQLQEKTRLVLNEEQRKIYDENVAAAKKGGKKKAAAQ